MRGLNCWTLSALKSKVVKQQGLKQFREKQKQNAEKHSSHRLGEGHLGLQERCWKSLSVTSHSHFLWQVFFFFGPGHRHPHTPTSARLRSYCYSHRKRETAYSSAALGYIPQALSTVSNKKSDFFYLAQAYQCVQLFDFLSMTQAFKTLVQSNKETEF